MTRRWLVLAEALRAAGVVADPAEEAAWLGAAGVPVTRNSAAQWIASPEDPRVRSWLAALAATAAARDRPGSGGPVSRAVAG